VLDCQDIDTRKTNMAEQQANTAELLREAGVPNLHGTYHIRSDQHYNNMQHADALVSPATPCDHTQVRCAARLARWQGHCKSCR
jgi:hypothetical protein